MKIVKLQLKEKGFMGLFLVSAFLAFVMLPRISGNAEGDALRALKENLADPYNVLVDWDPTQDNPCRWFRVTCNLNNSVTRVDLGEKNLSGELVPQLGQLPNLQYLELYSNNITGEIPEELGNLTDLVSLDLYWNKLTGPIPDTLGNLEKLRSLRLNNNNLSGNIPMTLTSIASLQVIDLSNNQLTGYIPANGSFALFTPTSFANNPGLKTQKLSPTPPPSERGLSSGPAKEISPPLSPSAGISAASSVLPTSVASFLLPLIIAIFSGF